MELTVSRGNLGAKTYLIFAGFMIICWIYTFFCFPELNKRSAAEIDVMFAAKLPARQFRGLHLLVEIFACSLLTSTQVIKLQR